MCKKNEPLCEFPTQVLGSDIPMWPGNDPIVFWGKMSLEMCLSLPSEFLPLIGVVGVIKSWWKYIWGKDWELWALSLLSLLSFHYRSFYGRRQAQNFVKGLVWILPLSQLIEIGSFQTAQLSTSRISEMTPVLLLHVMLHQRKTLNSNQINSSFLR